MLIRAVRPLLLARTPLYRSIMSADQAPKRAHSASPPPQSPSTVPSTAADSAAAKRVKLTVEEPVSAPPNLVETPLPAAAASTSSTTTTTVEPKEKKNGTSNGKPAKASTKRIKTANGKRFKVKPPKPGGAEEAAAFDIVELLGKERVEELKKREEDEGWNAYDEAVKEWGKDKEGKDLEVRVVGISDHGDGLALLTPTDSSSPTRLLAIPFALPGELVKVHVHRHEPELHLSHGDLLAILERSKDRDLKEGEVREVLETEKKLSEKGKEELRKARETYGDRVQCRYFGQCSGCQYQPLAYEQQLALKQDVVRKAFANFSGLSPSLVPSIDPTLPSPLQYAYRTKLTPHFQNPPTGAPKGGWKKGPKGEEQRKAQEEKEKKRMEEWECTIGFEQKGRKRIVDIEECPIATGVINEAMVKERATVKANIHTYKRGATLLLRDSLPPRPADQTSKPSPYVPSSEPHIIITDHHATVREQVGPNEFEQQAGSFFQNNNSILPSLLDAVKVAIGPRKRVKGDDGVEKEEERFLVDAYTGSGLFAISLADMFDKIEGVEIDKASIRWAKRNAEFNKGPGRGEVGFIDGKAEEIFKDINFPSNCTTLVIDPPRKGCDDAFLDQLLRFNPSTVIYVSCNVRTQARDIGYVVKKSQEAAEKKALEEGRSTEGVRGYWVERVNGADFFPLTHHIESVAILRRAAQA